MPHESRLFLKTSLVALVLAFAWGAAMALCEALGMSFAPILAVEHAHLAFVGWLVNLVVGVAWWMLPLNREVYPATAGRYPRWAPLTVWILLNGGLAARLVSEPALQFAAARPILVAAGFAQAVGDRAVRRMRVVPRASAGAARARRALTETGLRANGRRNARRGPADAHDRRGRSGPSRGRSRLLPPCA